MMIRITSKKDGFRRAGRVHTGAQTYPAGEFTQEQLLTLKRDPMLVVDELPDGAAVEDTTPDLSVELAAVRQELAEALRREEILKEQLETPLTELVAIREEEQNTPATPRGGKAEKASK